MSTGNPDQRRRLDEFNEEIEKGLALVRKVRSQQAQGIQQETAANLRGVICSGDERVDALWCRHHDHQRRALSLVKAIVHLRVSGDKTRLNDVRHLFETEGAFLEEEGYSRDDIRRRLSSDDWVIAESLGIPRKGPHCGEFIHGGDCHCRIPNAAANASLVIRLPGEGDVLVEETALESATKRPYSIGCVTDLCSQKGIGISHAGFASQARDTAFHEIIRRNKERGEYKIDHMLAEIFCIKGIELPGGFVVSLTDHEESPIWNWRSLLIHARSEKHPARLVWQLLNRKTSIRFPTSREGNFETIGIIADWFCVRHNLR
jgi:hypothetical protein